MNTVADIKLLKTQHAQLEKNKGRVKLSASKSRVNSRVEKIKAQYKS